jgi:hypothetical protein
LKNDHPICPAKYSTIYNFIVGSESRQTNRLSYKEIKNKEILHYSNFIPHAGSYRFLIKTTDLLNFALRISLGSRTEGTQTQNWRKTVTSAETTVLKHVPQSHNNKQFYVQKVI